MTIGYDTIAGSVIGFVLFLASEWLLGRLAARREGPERLTLMRLAALVKFLVVPVYLFVFDAAYGNNADYVQYDHVGKALAAQLRQGVFSGLHGKPGTPMVSTVTGVLYAVIGSTRLGGFFVFGFCGFWGIYLFYRAFRIALPAWDVRRYALLVFFLPSLVFWPTAIGKEALVTLGLGAGAYGIATVFDGHPKGYVAVVVGLGGAAAIRPHVVAMLCAGIVVGLLVRRPRRRTPLSPILKVLSVAVILVVGLAVRGPMERVVGIKSLSTTSIDKALKKNEINLSGKKPGSSGYGSSFNAGANAQSITGYPKDVFTLLFRPLPFEAHGLPELGTSVENVFLFGLFLVGWRRLLGALRASRREGYVAMSVVYIAIFVYFFISLGNFGLLARERIQMLPFLLVLLAHPKRAAVAEGHGDDEASTVTSSAPGAASPGLSSQWRRRTTTH